MPEKHYYIRRLDKGWEVGEMSTAKIDFSGHTQSRERKPLRQFNSLSQADSHYRKLIGELK
jgi:hypothetical protein|nr:MAG TPA: hypothetical protein [Caudoviricetes sp.]